MRLVPTLICLLLFVASLPVLAFERPFPSTAKRGYLTVLEHPVIELNGKQRRLSPGGWIRNQNNLIDLPVALRGRQFVVHYTENSMGDVDRVWILTPEEAAKPAPADRQSSPNQNMQNSQTGVQPYHAPYSSQ